jgi:GNAT superfamily N-acetyltransferase
MDGVSVRTVTAADYAGWLPIWRAYQVFYEVDIAPVTDVTWARLLDANEPMYAALALHGAACVGLVHWVLHRSTWSIGDTCYLQDLFVSPERRGFGLGAALIGHVYEAARTAGCPDVYWLTHEQNATAMRLYDRVALRSGFTQYQMML